MPINYRLPRGVPTLLNLTRLICRAVGTFGTAGVAAAATPELAAALEALRSACHAFELLDSQPFERDRTVEAVEYPVVP